jgi:1-acyl-sn-glycerol-3-phosphate acyltransferase
MAGMGGCAPRINVPHGDLNGWWRFGVVVVGALARMVFRIRVTGIGHVPAAGPGIVAANHLSALDGVVLALVVGRRARRMTRYLVAAEFFGNRAFGWALRLYRQIPLRRGEADAAALDDAVRAVRSGALAGIFPEGRVHPAPEEGLQRGRTGVARIALASGSVVVPVGIWGTHRRYPQAGFHLRPPWRPVVALAFGPPLEPEGDPASVPDAQRFTERVMGAIAEQTGAARRIAER